MDARFRITGWLIAASLLCQGALADMQLTMSEKPQNDPSMTGETVISIRDGKVRFASIGAGAAGQVALFDSASGTFTQIDATRKTYMEMDRASMDQAADQVSEMMKQVEKQFANMPKDQRDAMMKSMPGLAAQMDAKETGSYEFAWVGGEGRYAGVECKKARLTSPDGDVSDACIAMTDDLGMSDADFEALAAMFDTMADFARRFSGDADMPDVRKMGGFPIATNDPGNGSNSELTAYSDASLDAELFEVPADYTRQTMPGLE